MSAQGTRESENTLNGAAPARAVFISYASEDVDAVAKIVDALRTAGIDVWFDRGELRGGEAWDQRIRQQIRDCALFLPIISRNTQARTEGYFRLEWRLADQRTHLMSRSRPFLVPICVDDTREKDAEVPDSFAAVHWLRAGDAESTRVLLERVKRLLNGAPGTVGGSSPAPPATPGTEPSARKYAIGIAVALVVALAMGAAYYLMRGADRAAENVARTETAAASQTARARSVVVLPFVDMSEKHDQDYFADGLTEELIDRLARSNDLRVIARTSAFYFKGKPTTIGNIVSLLHVTHVVEGSVRKNGKALRITAQLIRASDGTHEWSQTYDRSLSDIFDVQTDIASQVAKALSAALNGKANLVGTENVEAYSLFLQGQFYQMRQEPGDIDRAIGAFRHALQLDPGYAGAWVRLGIMYMTTGESGPSFALTEKEATAAVAEALRLDPHFSPAHRLVGHIERYYHWNWEGAAAAYERAVASADNPTDRLAALTEIENIHALRTGHYRSSYWDTAEQDLLRNPLNPQVMRSFAFDYMGDGQFEKGLALIERSLQISPSTESANSARAFALLLMSRFDESYAAAQREVSERAKEGILAMTTWSLGRRAESNGYVHALETGDTSIGGTAYMLAQIHCWRGERDLAFDWLDRAYRTHEPGIVGLRLDPLLKNIRNDSRYAALLKKMKLSG